MKHTLLSLLLLTVIASGHSFAQFSLPRQKTAGGHLYEFLYESNLTKDGGVIAGGSSNSNRSGDKSQNSRDKPDSVFNGGNDYWLVKYDKTGAIEWDRTYGGAQNDVCYAATQTSDGGYITGGLSYSNISGEKKENSRGQADYWIIKSDKWGRIQWQKTIGGSGYDYLIVVRQTFDGGYFRRLVKLR